MDSQKKDVKVEVYSKESCPFCVRAKELLTQKGCAIVEYAAGQDQTVFAEMLTRSSGSRTFPQIFINDQHVGGCDDLYALESKGRLDTLLSI